MERAARFIQKNKLSRSILNGDDIARAIWPAAVGKAIAAHTSRIRLVRTTLVVEVEDAIWQRQLHTLSSQILARLHRLLGASAVEDLEFRVGIPRRQPQTATHREGEVVTPSVDEADFIRDPALKRVYEISRKRRAG